MQRTHVDRIAEYYRRQEEASDEPFKEKGEGMKNVLVVDDEEHIRNVFQRLLKREGFNVWTAANAADARALLLKEPIDLVLLDINMPEVNGVTLYEIIDTFHNKIPIIVSSVYPAEEQRKRIRNADDYYDKSEGLRTLLVKVRTRLGGPESAKKVVVIEDEVKARVLFNRLLTKAGYETIGFADNRAALQYLKAQESKIDLLILDISMPHINGCYFHEMIKLKHPDTKVLVASSYPLEMQRMFIFDADEYFDKSDGTRVFLDKVAHLVN